MRPARYAELRKAAAGGTMPSSWRSGGDGDGRVSNAPPPCTIDRHHHWEETPTDGMIDFRYGIRHMDRCIACKMRRIRIKGDEGGRDAVAYAPNLEYTIWYVACRARLYAGEYELSTVAAALDTPRTGGGPSPNGGRAC